MTGFPSDGRLYIRYCFNGDWRRICTNSGSWTPNTAKVACRQLGYSDMSKYSTLNRVLYNVTHHSTCEVQKSAWFIRAVYALVQIIERS